MSFADELRNAPEKKKREEEEQRKRLEQQKDRDWDRFVVAWYESIKQSCIQQAEAGRNSCQSTLSDYFKYTLKGNLKSQSDEYWYERIKRRLEYQLNPKSEVITVCASEDDVAQLVNQLESKFKSDGLNTSFTKI